MQPLHKHETVTWPTAPGFEPRADRTETGRPSSGVTPGLHQPPKTRKCESEPNPIHKNQQHTFQMPNRTGGKPRSNQEVNRARTGGQSGANPHSYARLHRRNHAPTPAKNSRSRTNPIIPCRINENTPAHEPNTTHSKPNSWLRQPIQVASWHPLNWSYRDLLH